MNIIQTWKDKELPIQFKPCIESVFKYGKNWNYLFFTDEDIESFMGEQPIIYQNTYNNFSHKIQKIDFFRYLAIYKFGGLYLDLDVLLQNNIDEIINEPNICKFPIELENITDTIFINQGFHNLVGNYAFYSPAKHPFLKQIIDNIVNQRLSEEDIALAQSTNGDSPEQVFVYCTTGPILVTQTYIDTENRNSISLLRTYPFIPNNFGIFGKHCCFGSWK